MKYAFLAAGAAAGLAGLAAPAMAQDNSRYAPVQGGEERYSCDQLQQEAAVMEDEIGAKPAGAAFGLSADQAMGLGTDLAIRAGGAGAARVLGGLGGLGGLARGAMEQQEKAADERRELAQDRWYYLAGVYMGKGCDQPVPPPPAAGPVPPPPLPQSEGPGGN
mgnify:CR=1 FL=1